jgi:hypothetical protein
LREDLFSLKGQTPVSQRCFFTHAAQALLSASNTLIESGMDLFQISGSGRVESSLRGVKLLELRNL